MDTAVVKRAYSYRFYPTPRQATELAGTFGSVRYVDNRALAERFRAIRAADGTRPGTWSSG